MRQWLLVAWVLFAAPAGLVLAQEAQPVSEPTPAPSEEGLEPVLEPPEVKAPDSAPALVRLPVEVRRGAWGTEGKGVLGEARAVSLEDGEARLGLQGTVRTFRRGDTLGSDIVKSIGSDQIVLERPASVDPKLGRSLVVVRFDEQGRPRVRVISARSRSAEPPEIE